MKLQDDLDNYRHHLEQIQSSNSVIKITEQILAKTFRNLQELWWETYADQFNEPDQCFLPYFKYSLEDNAILIEYLLITDRPMSAIRETDIIRGDDNLYPQSDGLWWSEYAYYSHGDDTIQQVHPSFTIGQLMEFCDKHSKELGVEIRIVHKQCPKEFQRTLF